MSTPPFGRVLTAMVTPFAADGSVDLDVAADLAGYLVDEMGNDGLVISGTTGESPTTSDAEKADLLRVVLDAVGDRARILAGVGTFDTEHTLDLVATAAKLGANGLLVVTPYYSKPPQAGILEHFRRVADSTDMPVMLYDIPGRAAVAIATDTMLRLSEHPRIVAVKDAKGDLTASARVIAQSELAYYSGDDAMTLPLLSIGAVGVVGTSTHFSAVGTRQMIEAYLAGDTATAGIVVGAPGAGPHRRVLGGSARIGRRGGVRELAAGLPRRRGRRPQHRCLGHRPRAAVLRRRPPTAHREAPRQWSSQSQARPSPRRAT